MLVSEKLEILRADNGYVLKTERGGDYILENTDQGLAILKVAFDRLDVEWKEKNKQSNGEMDGQQKF